MDAPQASVRVEGLDGEFPGEDVGELGAVPVPPAREPPRRRVVVEVAACQQVTENELRHVQLLRRVHLHLRSEDRQ